MKKVRILSLVLAIIIVISSFAACGKKEEPKDDTKKDENNELYSEKVAVTANHSVDFSEMGYLFYTTFSEFYSNYESYISYLGLDASKSFKEQNATLSEEDETWFDYFLKNTRLYCEQFLVLTEALEAEDGAIPDDVKKTVDEQLKAFKDYAKEQGYEFDDYLKKVYKNGVTEEDVKNVMTLTFASNAYYKRVYNGLTYTDEEMLDYCKKNLGDDYHYVNIRHILVDDEGKANELLKKINASSKPEETFIQLAKENSSDGNASSGGIYTDVYKGQMVATFNDWCFDESRKPGDTGVVKTEYGYHVMYFIENSEKTYYSDKGDSGIRSEKFNERFEQLCKEYPVVFNDELMQKLDV